MRVRTPIQEIIDDIDNRFENLVNAVSKLQSRMDEHDAVHAKGEKE